MPSQQEPMRSASGRKLYNISAARACGDHNTQTERAVPALLPAPVTNKKPLREAGAEERNIKMLTYYNSFLP